MAQAFPRYKTYAPALDIKLDINMITKASHKKLMRKVLRRTAELHHSQNLKHHFFTNSKTSPGGEYGYRKRNKEYTERKFRKYGHRHPLQWSSRLMRRVLKKGNEKITATSNGSRLRINAIYFPTKYAIKRELEAISGPEAIEQVERMQKEYFSGIRIGGYARRRAPKKSKNA